MTLGNATCATLFADINECDKSNGNCSQMCFNTIGSYYCSCTSGYVLNSNNLTCNGK